ncbi:hypothetical protein [Achromobacter sp.]|uniref:hypothetical protein n=1 Tax=Achromobacter sp. TaxID=134375 RepID=UPI002F9494B4
MNIRASSYFVLQAAHACTHCGEETPVHALAVPPGHQCTEADIELDEADADSPGLSPAAFSTWLFNPPQWLDIGDPALISQTWLLSPTVAQAMQALSPHYRENPDNQGQWTNFCAHCGRPVSEGALYPKPGQAFSPADAAAAARIHVRQVDEPFEAYYGMCWTASYRNKWPLFARLGYEYSEAG